MRKDISGDIMKGTEILRSNQLSVNKRNPNRIRLTVTMDIEQIQYLEEWATQENQRRDFPITKNELAALILRRAIEKNKIGDHVDTKTITEEQFSQINKYLSLLTGKHTQNDIDFPLIAEVLGIGDKELNDLFLLVQAFRGVPDLPSGYEWKIVKKQGETNK